MIDFIKDVLKDIVGVVITAIIIMIIPLIVVLICVLCALLVVGSVGAAFAILALSIAFLPIYLIIAFVIETGRFCRRSFKERSH